MYNKQSKQKSEGLVFACLVSVHVALNCCLLSRFANPIAFSHKIAHINISEHSVSFSHFKPKF
jgi:hypothetical protein